VGAYKLEVGYMPRDLAVFVLATCAAFAQPHAKFVTLDIAVDDSRGQPVSCLRSGEIEIFEASEYLYFYAVMKNGVLIPVHALPKPNADSPPANSPWMARILPQFELSANLYRVPGEDGMVNYSRSRSSFSKYRYI
jgi:hypothetical protein